MDQLTARLERATADAVGYLVRQTGLSGRYAYVYDWERRRSIGGYNLVRHAGTMMELARFITAPADGGVVSVAVEANWRYLETFFIPVKRRGRDCICVVEKDTAKLGATALALVALANKMHRAGAHDRDFEIVRSLATYLAAQQRDNGEFISKEVVSTETPLPFESVYYAGEACLALCCAYRLTGDREFLDRASAGARALVSRQPLEGVNARYSDHWLIKCLAELYFITQDAEWVGLGRRAVSPIQRLPHELQHSQDHWLVGSSTTGLATRAEALLAMLAVEINLRNVDAICRLTKLARAGVDECLARQVTAGIDGDADPTAVGGFVQKLGGTTIRIDYVHHPLGAAQSLRELDGLRRSFDFATQTSDFPRVGIRPLTAEPPSMSGSNGGEVGDDENLRRMQKKKGTGVSWSPAMQIVFHRGAIYINRGPTKLGPATIWLMLLWR